MSVLIKGMKMPTSCFDCPFMHHRTLCVANTKLVFDDPDYSELKGRYDGCPLIELPDHGDLIERQNLIDELAISEEPDNCSGCASYNSYDDFCCRSLEFQNMCRSIRTAPVVIPAERE